MQGLCFVLFFGGNLSLQKVVVQEYVGFKKHTNTSGKGGN